MPIYFVNDVPKHSLADWNHSVIGLFTNADWKGEGNFCGYYSSEYYLNTVLLAIGIQERNGGMLYDPLAPFDGGFLVEKQYYEKIAIGSDMWTKSFFAENDDEAIEIFKKQKWKLINN